MTAASSLPAVSIVTLSFNQGAFLGECIESVLEQKYSGLEYIVVDPGSSDQSREVIARFGAQISRILLAPDDGPADGLNHGFERARGEIFGYINADDRLAPNCLHKVARFFESHPEVD